MVDWDFPNIKHPKRPTKGVKNNGKKTPAFPVGFESFCFHLVDEFFFRPMDKNRFSELFGENFSVREDGCKHV